MKSAVLAAIAALGLAGPAAALDHEVIRMDVHARSPHQELTHRFPGLRAQWFEKNSNHPTFGARFWGENRKDAMQEEGKAKNEVIALLKKYEDADDQKSRNMVRKEIKELLANVFDMRQKREKEHTQALAKKLEKLRRRIDKRKQAKDEIVKKRLLELIGETKDSDLDWY